MFERYEEKSYMKILKVEAVAVPPPEIQVTKLSNQKKNWIAKRFLILLD